MKKIIRVLLIVLLFIPAIVFAKQYSQGKDTANNHIRKYSNYQDYILYDNLPFVYNDGRNSVDLDFKLGGFLNIDEYIISLPKGGKTTSYLSIGDEFFLYKKSGGNSYVIAGASANETYNGKNVKGLKKISNDDSGVRVTEFVKPETQIMGSGTMTNPWYFTANFNLDIEFPKGAMSSLEVTKDSSTKVYTADATEDSKKLEKNCYNNNCELDLGRYKVSCTGNGCSVKLKIKENGEYKYAYNTCGGRKVGDYLVIDKLIKDTRCKLMFGSGTYKVTIGDDPTGVDAKTSPKEVYLRYGENFYTDREMTKVVTGLTTGPDSREGFTYEGYYYNEVPIINTSGKFIDKTTIAEDTVLKSKWTAKTYVITYENLTNATFSSPNPLQYTVQDDITLNNPTKTGYTFLGWTGSNGTTPQTTVKITHTTGNKTYRANWKDSQPPSATISTTNSLKNNKQTLTATFTDNVGVTAYYLGTKSSPTDSDYVTVSANTSITAAIDVTAAGTYYVFCKDAENNVSSAKSKTYYAYKVENRLQNVEPSSTPYTSTDYAKIGNTLTYIAEKDTALTLSSIYTIPSHSRSGRFMGVSLGTASTTAASVSKTNQTLTTNNQVYTMWFNRNLIHFKYKVLSGETFNQGALTTYSFSTDANGYVQRTNNGSTTNDFNAYRYGTKSINLYDNNPTGHFYITKTNYTAKPGGEWVCVSGCATSGKVFNQKSSTETGEITNTDTELCNTSTDDCTIELKVNWVNTYAITYNKNTTESVSGMPSNQTKIKDQSITLSSNSPTRSGYSFSGWNTKADGSGTNYSGGTSYTTNADLTLYAKWTNVTYTISYNKNTSDSVSNIPGNQTKTYGQTITLSSNTPTRTGYTFNGWNTKADGTGTSYAKGGSYSANESATLYVVWKANTYTISYNANGGSGQPGNQTKTHGVNLTLSSTVPTRTHYTFNGWNTKADGTGTNYAKGATYTANAGVTLYAKWLLCNRWQLVGDLTPYAKQRWEFYRNCTKVSGGWIYTSNQGNDGSGTYIGPDSSLDNPAYVDWQTYLNQIYNSNGYKSTKDNYYYINSDGYMISGWQYINGNWYYFNNDIDFNAKDRGGMMMHDRNIGGEDDYKTVYGLWDKNKKVHLNSHGVCDKTGDKACKNMWLRTGYIYENIGGTWYNRRYWQYAGSDGKPLVNTTWNGYTFDAKGRCSTDNYRCNDPDINGYAG